MPEISIIVPVYQAEKYLEECIKSIIQQTFTDFELLLIDDGSKDLSGEICEKYALSDSRIRVFHKKNGGVSSARNLGLDNSTGKYICFVDSDDLLQKNFLKDFFDNLVPNSIGLIVQGYSHYDIEGKLIQVQKFDNDLLAPSNMGDAFSKHELFKYGAPYLKIFDAGLLRSKQIRFAENIHRGEDLIFTLEYLKFVEFVKFTDAVNYQYRTLSLSSLVQKHYSYELEYECFRRYFSALEGIKESFSLSEDMLESAYDYGLIFFMRAINTMYRPQNFLKRSSRLLNLKSIEKKDFELLLKYYKPKICKDRIAKALLLQKSYVVFDIFNRVLFALRYRFELLWKQYRS